jgi:hypothetical protein
VPEKSGFGKFPNWRVAAGSLPITSFCRKFDIANVSLNGTAAAQVTLLKLEDIGVLQGAALQIPSGTAGESVDVGISSSLGTGTLAAAAIYYRTPTIAGGNPEQCRGLSIIIKPRRSTGVRFQGLSREIVPNRPGDRQEQCQQIGCNA